MEVDESSTTELKFDGHDTAGHVVPADALGACVQRLQRMMLIEAACRNGVNFDRSFRPPDAFRDRHRLVCGVPKESSYAVPLLEASDPSGEGLYESGEDRPSSLGRVLDYVEAVRAEDPAARRRLLPDGRYEGLMLRETEKLTRLAGKGLRISLSNGHPEPILLDAKLRTAIQSARTSDAGRSDQGSFVGRLQAHDYANRRVALLHPVTDRQVACTYRDDAETDLFDSRRELVRVVGELVRDAEDEVISVSDARVLEAVDLSPIEVEEVPGGEEGAWLRIDPPLVLKPALDDESWQLLIVHEPELDLHASGETPDALVADVAVELAFAWRVYAEAEPESLSPDAADLRMALRQRLRREDSPSR